MPLLTCPDCSKQHSDLAHACPNCGRPQLPKRTDESLVPTSPRKSSSWPVPVLLAAIVIALAFWGSTGEASQSAVAMAVVIGGLCLYFAPTIIANRREHPKKTSIQVVNFFLGWTLVGWVVSLAWAVSEPKK